MGTPTEREVLRGILNDLQNLRDRFSSLAIMRQDPNWAKLAVIASNLKASAEKLFTARIIH